MGGLARQSCVSDRPKLNVREGSNRSKSQNVYPTPGYSVPRGLHGRHATARSYTKHSARGTITGGLQKHEVLLPSLKAVKPMFRGAYASKPSVDECVQATHLCDDSDSEPADRAAGAIGD